MRSKVPESAISGGISSEMTAKKCRQLALGKPEKTR
jgi:hypothetical protein